MNEFDNEVNPSFAADTFEFFKDRQVNYDLNVVDPPAFAKHRSARHQAIKGYQRLNATAIRAVKQGGLIFSCSCSQVVDQQLFYDTAVSAAIQTGRTIDVLHHLSQPADHPVSLSHPEGEYLKGLCFTLNDAVLARPSQEQEPAAVRQVCKACIDAHSGAVQTQF